MSLINRLHNVLESSPKDQYVELRTSTSMEELRKVANLEDIPLDRLRFVERLEDGEYGLLDMEENIFYRTAKDVERGFETYSGTIMTFEDPEIKKWLVANIGGERGITNSAYGKVGVRGIAGEVTYEQALATEDVSIPRNKNIRRFNELVYFKNLKRFKFQESSIEEISLPYLSIETRDAFTSCTRLRKVTTKYGLDLRTDYLFRFCNSLVDIDTSGWTFSGSSTERMFEGCRLLTRLDLRSSGMDNMVVATCMFSGCSSLREVLVDGWNLERLSVANYMFSGCSSLQSLDTSKWNLGNLSNGDTMFYGCSSLQSLDTSKWNLGNLSYSDNMFSGCSSLHSLDTSKWNLGNLSNSQSMFYGCSSLHSLDTSKWNLGNLSNGANMFYGCSSLQSLDTSKWNLGNLSNGATMFYGCSSLQSLDTSKWNLGNLSNSHYMFSGCSSLQSLDTSKWNLGNLSNGDNMFSGCSSLQSLDTSKWNLGNLSNSQSMFSGCSSLQSLDTSKWNLGNLSNGANMFYGCSSLQSLDTSKWNLEKVTDLGSTFEGCRGLTELGSSSWNLIRCSYYRKTFNRCNTLVKIDLTYSKTPISIVNNQDDVLNDCINLESIVGDHNETDDVSVFNGYNSGEFNCMYYIKNLNLASILAAIRGVGTNNNKRKFKLPIGFDKSRIPQEYKTMLENKNWELA